MTFFPQRNSSTFPFTSLLLLLPSKAHFYYCNLVKRSGSRIGGGVEVGGLCGRRSVVLDLSDRWQLKERSAPDLKVFT